MPGTTARRWWLSSSKPLPRTACASAVSTGEAGLREAPCGLVRRADRINIVVLASIWIMNRSFMTLSILIFLTACAGAQQPVPGVTQTSPDFPMARITGMPVPESTLDMQTLEAIPSFTPLADACASPAPDDLNDFINRSITIAYNGRTFITHVTSRFWIYLDDRIYPLRELLSAIPDGLIGTISNGSIRGPQCYPIMFEAVREGRGLIQIKDFQFSIIVDNNLPESPLPLP